MAPIVLDHVSKVFPGGVLAVRDLSLRIDDGELFVLLGPSGSGKSVALRVVAGLEEQTTGTVSIGGVCVNGVPAHARDVAMVFEGDALYPHLTVYDNLAFGLRRHHRPTDEIDRKVRDVARLLELTDRLGDRPGVLSGAHRQAVALGRAIVREPVAFLMDEPFSSLDPALRAHARAEIARVQRRLGVTTLLVTEDPAEAMAVADRLAVLRAGVLQQVGRPVEVYDQPANAFVASFVGASPMNLTAGRVEGGTLRFGAGVLPVPAGLDLHEGPLLIGIRPTDLRPTSPSAANLRGLVDQIEMVGRDLLVHVVVDMPAVHLDDTSDRPPTIGDPPSRWVARVDLRTEVRLADTIHLAIDPARVHLFARDGTSVSSAP